MTKFDWWVTIENCLFLLRCTGVWPKKSETYSFSFYTFYAITALTIFVIADAIFQCIMIYFIMNDLTALAASIYILPSKIALIFKIFKFISNIKFVKKLVEELNNEVFQPADAKQIKLIQSNFWEWKVVAKIIWFSTAGGMIFFLFFPLLDKSDHRRLLFPSWYPFETQKSPFYEITFVYQVLSLLYVGLVNIDIDLFLSAVNMYIGCQFDLLCYNLQNLRHNNKRKILKCYEHHQQILKYKNAT